MTAFIFDTFALTVCYIVAIPSIVKTSWNRLTLPMNDCKTFAVANWEEVFTWGACCTWLSFWTHAAWHAH